MNINLIKNKAVFEFDYDEKIIESIKKIPKRNYNAITKTWEIPINHTSIDYINVFAKYFKFNISKELQSLIDESLSIRKENLELSSKDKTSTYTLKKPINLELKPFQLAGVEYCIKNLTRKTHDLFKTDGILIGDEMGCVSGDSIVQINRNGCVFNTPLKEAFEKFNQLNRYSWYGQTEMKCLGNGQFTYNVVEKILYKGIKKTIEIETESHHKLILTPDHEVLSNEKWIEIGKLNIYDSICISNDNVPTNEKIISITESHDQPVYDVVMCDPHRNFIANNIVVHNCGKTIESIAVLNELDAYPLLVICPNTLKYNWEIEFNKCIDGLDIGILTPKETTFGKDVTILNYDNLQKYEKKLIAYKFKSIIFDESHFLKSDSSIRSKVAIRLRKKIKYKIELSGTPIVNNTVELINQADIINILNHLGGSWYFKNRYCDPEETGFGISYKGSSNTKELHTKLRSIGYLRRNKADVLKDLPEKIKQIIPFELSNKKEYNKASYNIVKHLQAILDKNNKDISLKEKRILNASLYKKMATSSGVIKLEVLKQLAVKGILKSAIEWIENFIEHNKLVLFCHHIEIVKVLQEHFKCDAIRGGVSVEERQRIINDFQNNVNTKLIIGNIKAMSVGVTLTAAHSVAFLEYPDTPGELDQAEDRVYRIGQTNKVTIYYLIGKNSIYDHLIRLIEEKRLVTNQVNAGIDEVVTTEISILNELLKIYSK